MQSHRGRGWVGRISKRPGILAVLGIAAIAPLLTALWRERKTEVTLPTPTGSFAVGRALYDWVDHKTQDALAPAPGIANSSSGSGIPQKRARAWTTIGPRSREHGRVRITGR